MLDDIPENISLPRDSILQNLLDTSQIDNNNNNNNIFTGGGIDWFY